MPNHTITDTTDGKTITAEASRTFAPMLVPLFNTWSESANTFLLMRKSCNIMILKAKALLLSTVTFSSFIIQYFPQRYVFSKTKFLIKYRRSIVDWLDEPIDRNAERFFDLAAEFWGDRCLVNFFGTKSQLGA